MNVAIAVRFEFGIGCRIGFDIGAGMLNTALLPVGAAAPGSVAARTAQGWWS